MTYAFVFPGQGSQSVGMGKDLAEAFPTAKHVFQEVDDALGQNLSKIMFEGPEDALTLTENTQPALMAVSMAIMRVLTVDAKIDLASTAKFVAGHSLGEYSALAAAGAFSLSDTAKLLRKRGSAMQRAVPVGVGAMAALLGADLALAKEIAEQATQGEICTVANDNGGQVVISGHKAAIERAVAIAAERGVKRSVILPVSAPFHCPLMKPAAEEMAKALAGVQMQKPIVPLIANITASAVSQPDEIKRLLVEQVTGMVCWRESVLYMKAQGVDTIVEIGSGKVLSGLVKRIDKDLTTVSIQTPADVDGFVRNASAL